MCKIASAAAVAVAGGILARNTIIPSKKVTLVHRTEEYELHNIWNTNYGLINRVSYWVCKNDEHELYSQPCRNVNEWYFRRVEIELISKR